MANKWQKFAVDAEAGLKPLDAPKNQLASRARDDTNKKPVRGRLGRSAALEQPHRFREKPVWSNPFAPFARRNLAPWRTEQALNFDTEQALNFDKGDTR